MKKLVSSLWISGRIWVLTCCCALAIAAAFVGWDQNTDLPNVGFVFLAIFIAFVASSPAFICMIIILPLIRLLNKSWQNKIRLFLLSLLVIIILCALLIGLFRFNLLNNQEYFNIFISDFSVVFVSLFACILATVLLTLPSIFSYFSNQYLYTLSFQELCNNVFLVTTKPSTMEQTEHQYPANTTSNGNRILLKGLITGGLILLMLIPTLFINSLIEERQMRQKEVVKEVSSKWANAQTLSAPFISIPYTENINTQDGKIVSTKTNLIVLADKLRVTASMLPEERQRSIYKVLLYRASINFEGNFKPLWPADIDTANLDFENAKLCFALSDFKGIEEEMAITLRDEKLTLRPGLPVSDIGEVGLSVPIKLMPESLAEGMKFSMQLKIKGSEQLHFLPLSANSSFKISSSWASPSFDGSSLPNQRQTSDSGFISQWNFTGANLPFATVAKTGEIKTAETAFGVSLVQPADQYNKTTRSVKYAILLIGLTFALFFIIELMQKNPLHPVQYVLVGLALVIFYTLLLSISEYVLFNIAYSIAAAATVLLITMYAKGHFQSWKSASIFGSLLACLYSFIYVLISLEDTALLIGSIGLFIILALVMYGSRKINWYGIAAPKNNSNA